MAVEAVQVQSSQTETEAFLAWQKTDIICRTGRALGRTGGCQAARCLNTISHAATDGGGGLYDR